MSPVVIIAQSQLEPVSGSIDRSLGGFKIVRIKIEGMNGVGIVRPAKAIIIQFKPAAQEIPYPRNDGFINQILQFKPLLLQSVILCHRSATDRAPQAWSLFELQERHLRLSFSHKQLPNGRR